MCILSTLAPVPRLLTLKHQSGWLNYSQDCTSSTCVGSYIYDMLIFRSSMYRICAELRQSTYPTRDFQALLVELNAFREAWEDAQHFVLAYSISKGLKIPRSRSQEFLAIISSSTRFLRGNYRIAVQRQSQLNRTSIQGFDWSFLNEEETSTLQDQLKDHVQRLYTFLRSLQWYVAVCPYNE